LFFGGGNNRKLWKTKTTKKKNKNLFTEFVKRCRKGGEMNMTKWAALACFHRTFGTRRVKNLAKQTTANTLEWVVDEASLEGTPLITKILTTRFSGETTLEEFKKEYEKVIKLIKSTTKAVVTQALWRKLGDNFRDSKARKRIHQLFFHWTNCHPHNMEHKPTKDYYSSTCSALWEDAPEELWTTK